MGDILIRAQSLSRVFSMGEVRVKALDGAELALGEGSFAAVIGPSGSGKSTLLYLLGGLDRPTSGSLVVRARQLDQLDENALAAYRQQEVGFVFQSFNLVQSMTALENVAYPMVFAGVGRKERRRRAEAALGQVGLEDRMAHKPSELSGGQQQRVAVARALVNDPRLILADEPTGNLDTHSGAQIMQLLADLNRLGKTVIVVSHDPRASLYATETIRLLDGRVVDEQTYNQTLELLEAGGAAP